MGREQSFVAYSRAYDILCPLVCRVCVGFTLLSLLIFGPSCIVIGGDTMVSIHHDICPLLNALSFDL